MNARCRGVFAVEKVLNPTAILEQLVVYKDGLATYVIDVQFVDNIKAVQINMLWHIDEGLDIEAFIFVAR